MRPPHQVRAVWRSGRGAHRATQYARTPWPEYRTRAQSDTLVVVQIEGQAGLANLDEVMATDGVDVLYVGPFDLSESLGVSGQLDHPVLLAAAGEIVERARDRNIALGIWMPTCDGTLSWIQRGVQLVTVASSDMIFAAGCQTRMQQMQSWTDGTAG